MQYNRLSQQQLSCLYGHDVIFTEKKMLTYKTIAVVCKQLSARHSDGTQ